MEAGDARERGPIMEREFRESERTRKANARDYMNAMPGAMQLYPGGETSVVMPLAISIE